MLPPTVDFRAASPGAYASREDADAVLAPELERDLVPVLPGTAAVIEPAASLGLELSEVRSASASGTSDGSPTDIDPCPPAFLIAELAPPGVAEAAVAPNHAGATAATVGELVAEAVSAVPSPSNRAPAVSANAIPTLQSAERLVVERRRSPVALVTLWIATALVPAAAVFALMRTPKHEKIPVAARTLVEYRAQPSQQLPGESAVPPQVAAPASAAATATGALGPDTSAAAPAEAELADAATPGAAPQAVALPSAVPSAEISSEVVVETDSKDRVSVLVNTRPPGARVLRRSKEIGRTPLTIQIGRGEHRIFEVSMVGFGAKRITLDGEKPEIMVNMATEAKPQTVVVPAPAQPAPASASKYEPMR